MERKNGRSSTRPFARQARRCVMKATLAIGTALAFAFVASAADEGGPKAGEKVPALKAFGVAGSVEGKEADFAAQRKDAPTVYLFVKAEEGGIPVGGRPLARFR
jgi:hypothetical protein